MPFSSSSNNKDRINQNTLNDNYLFYCAILFAIYAIKLFLTLLFLLAKVQFDL